MTITQTETTALIDFIKTADIKDLGGVCEGLADRIMEHRASNNGFVPRELFPHILAVGGQYTCLEYVLQVVDSDSVVMGYLLKQRGSEEQGWHNQFHIPGVAIVVTPKDDMMVHARNRLESEFDFITDEQWASLRSQIKLAGVEAHDEPERKTCCLTFVQTLDLPMQAIRHAEQTPKWKFFPIVEGLKDKNVVDHHIKTLTWLQREDRIPCEFVDLRKVV